MVPLLELITVKGRRQGIPYGFGGVDVRHGPDGGLVQQNRICAFHINRSLWLLAVHPCAIALCEPGCIGKTKTHDASIYIQIYALYGNGMVKERWKSAGKALEKQWNWQSELAKRIESGDSA
jgi:hypothetical protein